MIGQHYRACQFFTHNSTLCRADSKNHSLVSVVGGLKHQFVGRPPVFAKLSPSYISSQPELWRVGKPDHIFATHRKINWLTQLFHSAEPAISGTDSNNAQVQEEPYLRVQMVVLTRLVRVVQVLITLYLVVSVIYTTHRFVLSPLYTLLGFLSAVGESLRGSDGSHVSWFYAYDGTPLPPEDVSSLTTMYSDPSKEVMFWPTSDFVIQHGLGSNKTNEGTSMSEELFLSKAFARSMRPSQIIPFFYRSTGNFDQDDITITTLVTSNRFKVFASLVEQYKGPISVTIHVSSTPEDAQALLSALHTLYTSSPYMSMFVDVHLVLDMFDRQLNTWRNIARLFARTNFVMMLDVDFAVCTDFRSSIRASSEIMGRLKEGDIALVVPAFEYVKQADGVDQKSFPKTKEALLTLVKNKKIDMFHRSWAPGHNSTDYPRFYSATPGEVYKVTHYQSAYEPYVIFKKEGPPWCDERFIGYGGNKAACLFEMYLSGISFYVLSDHFLVHQSHLYEEAVRKQERKDNRKIYQDFKEETCLRYLKRYYDEGTLNTTQGQNVQEECKRIKGISRVAAQLIDGKLDGV